MTYTSPNSQKPLHQFTYLAEDLKSVVNRRSWRWISIWCTGVTYVLVSYRLDRLGFLLFKKAWSVIRICFFPFSIIFHILGSHHEIHYTADIGGGFKILHSALGLVIAGNTIAGKGLLLTGGNCIGARAHIKYGDLVIGDDVSLGANAIVLGPIRIGNHVRIGAGAVVVDDAPDNVVLVGVPAKAK